MNDNAVREQLRLLADPGEARDVIAEVLKRRARGERVAIPDVVPLNAGPTRKSWLLAASIILALITISVLTLDVPQASAVRSELRLSPAAPVAGARIAVTYQPISAFAGID